MDNKTIITCALTGGADITEKGRAVPVTPRDIAQSGIDAAKAGAAIVHIHVRDPATGRPSMELALYREVVDRIRQADPDVIINLTTGAGARFVPGQADPKIAAPGSTLTHWERRVEHIVTLRPEICSLDVGSMNFGNHVFVNTPSDLQHMAKAILDAGVKPELEVFDLGHIRLAKHLIAEKIVAEPPLFQVCLGIPWGAPASSESMIAMRDQLPETAIWASFGIGARQFPMVAQAVLLGGHVRVGLEDNLYLRQSVLAKSNAELVAEAARILDMLAAPRASPYDARRILGLEPH